MRLPYYNNCVNWDRMDVHSLEALCDNAKEIAYKTFLKNVDSQQFLSIERELGYGSYLRMKDDYHVRFFSGKLHNKKAYFFIWSSIDYVFFDSGEDLWINSHILE